jgi:hypothetical protein
MNFFQAFRMVASSGQGQQVDKLRPLIRLSFPHSQDIKATRPHDARGMIAEAVVKGRLVMFEDFIDSQLMNHDLKTSGDYSEQMKGSPTVIFGCACYW